MPMSDIIEYGVKIPLYEITNVDEFNKSFKNQYNNGCGACETWYLISPISNFILESTRIKCKNGEYVKKEQIVYFYNAVMNLANILLYAKIDWIALPESALESPTKFITFVEKTFTKQ